MAAAAALGLLVYRRPTNSESPIDRVFVTQTTARGQAGGDVEVPWCSGLAACSACPIAAGGGGGGKRFAVPAGILPHPRARLLRHGCGCGCGCTGGRGRGCHGGG